MLWKCNFVALIPSLMALCLLQALDYWNRSKDARFDSAAFLRGMDDDDFFALVVVSWTAFGSGGEGKCNCNQPPLGLFSRSPGYVSDLTSNRVTSMLNYNFILLVWSST
jgi:hypothetical protein